MKAERKGFLIAVNKMVLLVLAFLTLIVVVFSAYRIFMTRLYPLKYKEQICYYADYYNLDRALIFSVIKTESNFDKNAVSNAGAVGLMQITEKTGEYIGAKLGVGSYQLINENDNINFGCYYINYLLAKFNNVQTALVAYNAGEGNVIKWLKDKSLSDDGISLKTIPYIETREYIKKINKNFSKYKELYKNFLDK